VQRSGP